MKEFVYIAAPFFNEKQLAFVKVIEDELENEGIEYFSPRSEGVLVGMTEAERCDAKQNIFLKNVEKICEATVIVAVIDDRDIGTLWEMGFAYANHIRTISISNENYGLNVMLAESVQAHTNSIPNMIEGVLDCSYKGENLTSLT